MKKKLLILYLCLIGYFGYSQIPPYYNDVNLNLSGQSLKDELAVKIISTHTTTLSYTPGVWDALKQTDLDPTDVNKVLLIYGWDDTDGDITNDRSRGRDMNGGNVGDWNREHVFARSLANPNLGTSGPGADAHNLRPADTQRNSSRSNRKFADGSGNSGITPQGDWYPGDEWKGDVARMMMYMYLRYGSQCLPVNVGIGNAVAGDPDMIDLFLQWNADDPVSALEMQRNPVLETLQGNRNPFIDNPAFATQIWGGPQAEDLFGGSSGGDTEVPSTPANLIASNINAFSIELSWDASTDNVGVTAYNVYQDGVFIASAPSNSYTAIGLSPQTSYSFYVEARDAAMNVSGASNTLNVSTSASSGVASDLFLSEYIEGSSFNKAIEVANFTGSSVDLSAYSIKKQTNGSGSWSGGVTLTGTLANGDVFVVANSSADPIILGVTNISTGSTEMTFNGNDAVGLFKNDVLIDILGEFNSSATYGQDVTLVRKSSVESPSTTYVTVEWDSYPTNTFADLGIHTFDGSGSGADTEAPTAPTALIASNITFESADLSWTASTDNVGVTEYDIYQDGMYLASTSSENYSVTGLLSETSYNFYVEAKDLAGNISPASNTVNVVTPAIPSGNDATDLFISEYIEGSSFNKAIEIANFTGATVDLSSYSVKKQTNGAGNWSGGVALTGNLVNGDVFVVAHSSSATAIQNEADILTGSTEVTFNGNDAVGLFKNDVLIDILGEFNSSATFAQNVTLVRKSSISSPNDTYTVSEWDSYASDTFTDLGVHTFDGGSTGPDTEAPTTPTSLVASNITFDTVDLSWTASTDNVGVTEYDVFQDGNFLTSTASTTYNVIALMPETSYVFHVVAKDAAGNVSASSNTENVTTTAEPDTESPTTPTSFIASNITETSVDLSWSASTDNVGVTGYDVYQDAIFLGSTTATNYNVTGLAASTSYTFEVIAFDAANNISTAATTNVTTSTPVGGGTTVLHEGFFEGGFDGWIDGGSDCSLYSGTRSYEGSYSIRLRDNSGASSSMTLQNIDVSPYDTVEFEFHFYAHSMENNEDFWLRYHDGTSWTTVATFVRGVDFDNSNFYSAVVTLDNATYNFVNNAQFRLQCDASANNDQIYIDQVSIKGITNGSSSSALVSTTHKFNETVTDGTIKNITYIKSLSEFDLGFEEDIYIVENPVRNNMLHVKFYGENSPEYTIVNLLGQTVKTGYLTSELININRLNSGIYILSVNDGEEIISKKFIKE